MQETDRLLEVKDLHVSFPTPKGTVHAVRGICYDVRRGEVLGIIGESGSGKSVEAFSIMRLLKPPGRIDGGSVRFDGEDVLSFTRDEMEAFRGREIGMIFQDPMSCLDPVFTIGYQLVEVLRNRDGVSKRAAASQSAAMLESVGIRDARAVMRRYPSSLSGGMRQRVMIAIALLQKPKLLIADEPTTSLDVTIQDQIMRLLKDMQQKTDMAMVFITHNFGLVADICDRVVVMYGGMILESGRVDDVFKMPAHPYTKGLFKAMPRVDFEKYERLVPIDGEPVNLLNPPAGCVFHPRCGHRQEICANEEPPVSMLSEGHSASCWLLKGRPHE